MEEYRKEGTFAPREYAFRRKAFRDLMRECGLHGLLVTGPPNLRYLCGFSGSSGVALLLSRSGWFLTDFRYREQSREEVFGLRTVIYEEDIGRALRSILVRAKGDTEAGSEAWKRGERDRGDSLARGDKGDRSPLLRIGYDPHTLTCAELSLYRKRLKGLVTLVPIGTDIKRLRSRKRPAELELMKRGISLAEAAFRETLRGLERGVTERELALELDYAARRRGAESMAFETIVAGGERSALVHARPSHARLDGAVVVDWGVIHGGYSSDCTRTLALGRVPEELKRAHRMVLEALEKALETVRPGVRASCVDRAAREVLEKAGYGKAFGHGLGHGVGLEIHEAPNLSPRSRDVLEEGMVVTMEPGVYIPGVGGVRVEDMVLVARGGAEVLTMLSRSLDPSDY